MNCSNTSYLLRVFIIFILIVDDILSESREPDPQSNVFRRWAQIMDICRHVCQPLRTFPDIPKANK